MAARRFGFYLAALAAVVCLTLSVPGSSKAAHYPVGSSCYDCHALSSGNIVAGTHLIKNSQKISDLGFSGGSLPCLFCHEQYAVSVVNRTTMKGVLQHFSAEYLSKHPVALNSTFGSSSAGALDCQSCHSGAAISTYVDPTGNPSNPTIHGINPVATPTISVASTLAGSPADATPDELDKTCNTCHAAAGGDTPVNGLTAVGAHAWGQVNETLNINDGAVTLDATSGCNSCHAGHGAPNSEKLLVFSDNAGNELAYNLQKSDCDACHVQDENGSATNNFVDVGHGTSTIGFKCDTCHKPDHGAAAGTAAFDKTDTDAAATARLRFSLTDPGTPVSSITGDSAPSICQSCHGGKPLHFGGTPSYVGCVDCHDQHGTTVFDGTDTNDKMIRLTVNGEATNLPTGRVNPFSGWANPSNALDAGVDPTGVCDNAACHPSLTTGLWNEHGGGDTPLQQNQDCFSGQGCHTTHEEADADGDGSFISGGCSGCHGGGTTGAVTTNYWPDSSNANAENDEPGRHQEHVDALAARFWGLDSTTILDDAASDAKQKQICAYCHEDPAGNNFSSGSNLHQNATVNVQIKTLWDTYAVDFAGSDGDVTFTDDVPGTCSNLDCHDNSTTGAGFGWHEGSASTCRMCHDGTSSNNPTSGLHAVNGANLISGSANVHDENLPGLSGGCEGCHVDAATELVIQAQAVSHIDGNLTVDNSTNALFADYTDGSPGTCMNAGGGGINSDSSCHTGATLDDGTWARRWSDTADDANGNECENCHGWFNAWAMGNTFVRPDMSGVAGPGPLTGNHDSDWDGDTTASELGPNHTGCLACHGITKGSNHANYNLGNSWNPKTPGSSMHGDGLIQIGGPSADDDGQGGPISTAYNANQDGTLETSDYSCAQSCHSDNTDHNMGDATGGAGADGIISYQDFGEPTPGNCYDCHGDESTQTYFYPDGDAGDNGNLYPNRAGLHVEHVTAIAAAIGGSVNDSSTCWHCHPTASGDNAHREAWDNGDTYPTENYAPADFSTDGGELFKMIGGTSDADATASNTAGGDATWGNLDDEVTCSNIDCHYESTPPVTSWYGGTTFDCDSCHKTTNAVSAGHNGAVLNGAHDKHADSSGYGMACTTCHTNQVGNAHQDGALDLDFTTAPGYTGSETVLPAPSANMTADASTCSAFYCHGGTQTGGSDTTPEWNAPATGACGTCHFDDLDLDTTSTRHSEHPTDTAAITNCNDCHTDVTVDNSNHVDGSEGGIDGSIGGTAITQFNATDDTNGTCVNTCHLVVNDAGDWYDANAMACENCHTASTGYVGDGANLQVSGLHGNNPTTSSVEHDGTLTGGCTGCHTSVPAVAAQGSHADGTMEADGPANEGGTQPRGLFADYTEAAVNASTCSGSPGVVGAAGCHDGDGEAGGWARIWSTTAYNSDGTECANCHGGLNANDWTYNGATAGNTDHERDWDAAQSTSDGAEVLTNHANNAAEVTKCNTCHVYADAPYPQNGNTHIGWVGNGANTSTYHGNDAIDMNDTLGYDAVTNFNCATNCHFESWGNNDHGMEDSGWSSVGALAGPAPDCFGCHGNGSDTYWPTGVAFPNRDGEHTIHMNRIANALGYTLPGTDAQQKHMCKYCHEDNPGQGGHGDGDPAEVLDFNPITDIADPPTTADAGSAFVAGGSGVGGTCNSIECHNNLNTPATNEWYDGSTSTCSMCHTGDQSNGAAILDPTSGVHFQNGTYPGVEGHDDNFGGASNYGCLDCHQANPTTDHGNGVANTPANTTFNWSVAHGTITDGGDADPTNDTCTADCHDDGGAWARKWNTTAYADISAANAGDAVCDNCHGQFGNWVAGTSHSNKNGGTASTAGSSHNNLTGVANGCEDCHTFPSTAVHMDGSIDINDAVGHTDDGTEDAWCGACHNDYDVGPNTDLASRAFNLSATPLRPVTLRNGPSDPSGGHPASGCTGCHNTTQGARRVIADSTFSVGDFSLAVHHIDDSLAVSAADKDYACAMCHWESEDGASNADGIMLKMYNQTGNTDNGADGGYGQTGLTYGTWQWNPADKASANDFCLGCHDNNLKGQAIFSSNYSSTGDTTPPNGKAWDEESVGIKFTDTAVGQYSRLSSNTYNVTPADQVYKAYSAHGNVANNHGGMAGLSGGTPGNIGDWEDRAGDNDGTGTRTGTTNVACIDCHNVHASDAYVERTWWVTRGANAVTAPTGSDVNGGLLASSNGSGGASSWHGAAYTPTAGSTPTSGFSYSMEADFCWDCHVGGGPNTYTNYGIDYAITMYDEGTGRWENWDKRTYAFKTPNSGTANMQSSHFMAQSNSSFANMGTGGGQCTVCHDPHGKSPRVNMTNLDGNTFSHVSNIGDTLPLLKGNWLTTPYKEEAPGDVNEYIVGAMDSQTGNYTEKTGRTVTCGPMPRENPGLHYNNPEAIGHGYGTGLGSTTYGGSAPRGNQSGTTANTYGHTGYFIDDNTWGTSPNGSGNYNYATATDGPTINWPAGWLAQGYEDHAGLCSVCHQLSQLTVGTTAGTLGSIHNTVIGIGSAPFGPRVGALVNAERGSFKMWSGDARQAGIAPHGINGNGSDPLASHGQTNTAGHNNDWVAESAADAGTETKNRWANYSWAMKPDDVGANIPHGYSCSKCHGPHARVLPRLMKSNCSETSHILNESRAGIQADRLQTSWAGYSKGAQTWTSRGSSVSYTNAMVCHGEDFSGPWNNVTPWSTGAAPLPLDGSQNWSGN